MKKLLQISLLGLAIALTTVTGCIKAPDITNTTSDLPDVGGFTLTKASSFIAGLASNVTVLAGGLSSGTFTIHYNLSGSNTSTDLTATLTMSGGTGTFKTSVLNTTGATTLTVTSVTNSNNKSSNITSGNSINIKAGSMSLTRNGVTFLSDEASASVTGSLLNIHGIKWDPLTTADVTLYYYANVPTIVHFIGIDSAGASYSPPSGIFHDAHGVINLISTSPMLTGTFSYTAEDSSLVTGGTFSVPAP